MHFRRLILLLTLICVLTACGQRGPLFLPEDTAAPAASQQAPDEPAAEVGADSEADEKEEDKVHGGGFEDGQVDES